MPATYCRRRMTLDRERAEVVGHWFGCLSVPSRVQILNLLATQRRPMSVVEIVAEMNLAQAAVSTHLRRLAEAGFVYVQRRHGLSIYQLNEQCFQLLPMAAEMVLGEVNPELFQSGEGGLRLTADAPTGPVVTELQSRHWSEAAEVLREAIDAGNALFETEVPSWRRWDASHLRGHRFVALVGHEVVGFVAVRPTSDSPAYGGVVEDSLYVSGDLGKRYREVGLMLLEQLVASTESALIWTVQAGIFPEDKAAIALHKRAGFRAVGSRNRVGKLNGTWRDVVLLERRSPTVT